MLVHYRHRRGMYPLAPRRAFPKRLVVTGVFVLLFLYFFGPAMLRLFGFSSPIERLPASLRSEDRGIVSVTLEGGESKRAENGMKLFPGEKLNTGPNGNASLSFFEGTVARLDQSTDVTIAQSRRSEEETEIALELPRGSLWILIPAETGSGAVRRTVSTPVLSFDLPPRTEAILSPTSLQVFSARGQGVSVSLKKHETVVIGEGQKLVLPPDVDAKDWDPNLYAYRSPLDAGTVRLSFLEESRTLWQTVTAPAAAIRSASGTDVLTITQPQSGQTVGEGTVQVKGTFSPAVDVVKVNGYPAVIDREQHSFVQEVSIPAGEKEYDIRVQAFDARQQPIADLHRLVRKGMATAAAEGSIPSPAITVPAKSGETYRTTEEEVVLRGTSPAEAAAMYVNDYKLQLFTPSKGTWSYLASTRLGNLKPGTNTYDVVAEDEAGRRSTPVRLTILWGEEGPTTAAASSAAADPQSLPQNAPLSPGTMQITGQAAQMGFVATGTGFLLEGTTSKATATVWVNDYQLKLYQPGKTFWNYIASPDLGTLKEGANAFVIVSRNEKGEILDKLNVTVTYRR
ncbi:MAG: hypothetical protein PHW10_04930 [Candidatus Peribacteraceae bacterium]|nr:hypothetical protein [Candidatus Peribacteraceae bacterium]